MDKKLSASLELNADDYINAITRSIEYTNNLRKTVEEAKKQLDNFNKLKVQVKVEVDSQKAIESVSQTKKHINDIKKNIAIVIAAKDSATNSINKIKTDIKSVVDKPYKVIIEAKDSVSEKINSIKNKISSVKETLSKVMPKDAGKKLFDWTLGSAMKGEEYSFLYKKGLETPKQGKEALAWAYMAAEGNSYSSEDEVLKGVLELGKNKIDYKKYLAPLEDLSVGTNKSLEEAIGAMVSLKENPAGTAVKQFEKFNITKEDWEKQGVKVGKDNAIEGLEQDQIMETVTRIINTRYGGSKNEKNHTAKGLISSMKATVKGMGRQLGGLDKEGNIVEGGVLDNFKKQLELIQPIIEKFEKSKGFEKIKDAINYIVSSLGGKLGGFLQNIQDPKIVDQYIDRFNKIKEQTIEFVSSLKEICVKVSEIVTLAKPIIDFMISNPNLGLGLFSGLKLGIPAINGSIDMVQKVKSTHREVGNVKKSSKAMGKGGKGPLRGLGNIFKDVGKETKSLSKMGLKGLKKDAKIFSGGLNLWGSIIGSTMKKNIMKPITELKKTLKGVNVGKELTNAFKSMKDLKIGKEFPNALKAAFDPLKSLFTGLGKIIKGFSKIVFNCLKSVVKIIIANPIAAIILGIIALVVLLYVAWTENFGGIREKTKTVIDTVVKEWVDFEKNMKAAWDRLKEFFKNPIAAIIKFTKEGTTLTNEVNNDPTKKNALGTSYFGGGWTWVGEQGPELMKLPGGSQIADNRSSNRMASGGGVNIAKLADTLIVREDADIDRIAEALASKLRQECFNMA